MKYNIPSTNIPQSYPFRDPRSQDHKITCFSMSGGQGRIKSFLTPGLRNVLVPPPLPVCLIIKKVPIYQCLESWLLYMARVGREGGVCPWAPLFFFLSDQGFPYEFWCGEILPHRGGASVGRMRAWWGMINAKFSMGVAQNFPDLEGGWILPCQVRLISIIGPLM